MHVSFLAPWIYAMHIRQKTTMDMRLNASQQMKKEESSSPGAGLRPQRRTAVMELFLCRRLHHLIAQTSLKVLNQLLLIATLLTKGSAQLGQVPQGVGIWRAVVTSTSKRPQHNMVNHIPSRDGIGRKQHAPRLDAPHHHHHQNVWLAGLAPLKVMTQNGAGFRGRPLHHLIAQTRLFNQVHITDGIGQKQHAPRLDAPPRLRRELHVRAAILVPLKIMTQNGAGFRVQKMVNLFAQTRSNQVHGTGRKQRARLVAADREALESF